MTTKHDTTNKECSKALWTDSNGNVREYPCTCPEQKDFVEGLREEWGKAYSIMPHVPFQYHVDETVIADWWFAKTKESYKQGILEGMRMGRKCEEERRAIVSNTKEE